MNTPVMTANLGRLFTMVAAIRATDSRADGLCVALAGSDVQWPPQAREALAVPDLNESVLAMVANVGAQAVAGEAISPDLISGISRRLRRYHAGRTSGGASC